MHLLVGLPIDKRVDDQEILDFLQKENNLDVFIPKIPALRWNSFEYMVCITEDIMALDKHVTDLFHNFLNRQRDILKNRGDGFVENVDFGNLIANFRWDKAKYDPASAPCEIFDFLSKGLEAIKSAFINRAKMFDNALGIYRENQKRQNGNLMEVDLSNFVRAEECEFIETVFVVVRKSDRQKFVADFQHIEHVQHATLELEKEDEMYVLYRFIAIKSKKDEITKKLKTLGYTVRPINKSGEVREVDFESISNNFKTFIDAEMMELFSLQLHLKYLRLYIECVLRYGLPNDYLYVTVKTRAVEKSEKILHSLAMNWPFSARHNPNKNKDVEFNSWIALCEIEDYGNSSGN
ncbi:V-type proton ATPase subunit C [Dictyocoela roeselum]|nr:V-type proton ATPase subunit C [Dictyocoela roeselum]